ncbi:GNAT family N-acetyltransferase [Haloarchaeobius sp. DFWS5]|uniref:GNAT family N-acetyltransferase n=1 Tax=Haloarchaeobius sp. DFWS5 TaxID=3446114 RepID=UPI003EB98B50
MRVRVLRDQLVRAAESVLSTLGWLYDLVVDESHRAEGYGTLFVEFVEQWADERGCEYVILASSREKVGVHRYYQNRNYEK